MAQPQGSESGRLLVNMDDVTITLSIRGSLDSQFVISFMKMVPCKVTEKSFLASMERLQKFYMLKKRVLFHCIRQTKSGLFIGQQSGAKASSFMVFGTCSILFPVGPNGWGWSTIRILLSFLTEYHCNGELSQVW